MHKKTVAVLLGCSLAVAAATTFAQAPAAPAAPAAHPPMFGMPAGTVTPAMQKSMDPGVWMQLMTMSMNPQTWSNPIGTCALCHTGEDMARYQKTFGPSLSAMANPAMWMNPTAYMGMMGPMMDPKQYEAWYQAWMQKGGAAMGGAMPYGQPAAPAAPAAPAKPKQ